MSRSRQRGVEARRRSRRRGQRGPARREAGFTLIEMMIVVAIIAILAILATVAYEAQARKGEAAEVHAMFAEFQVKEEQYHAEHGAYLSTGSSETDTWPLTPSVDKNAVTPMPATWTALGIHTEYAKLYCSYVAIAGPGGNGTNIGPEAGSFGFTTPAQDWYYLLAHCDFDGDPTVDSFYFVESGNNDIQIQNEGH